MLGKLLKRKKKDTAEGGEAKEGDAAEEKKDSAAEKTEGGEAKEGEAGAEGDAAPKKGKRKIVIIGGAVALLLVIVGALFGLGVIGGGGDGEEAGHEETATAEGHGGEHGEEGAVVVNAPVYYELPEFLVNLSSNTNRTSFLKMRVTLELKEQASVALVDANKPRIVDTFNTYLRELRPQDVQGSVGIYRLRDELLTRINGTIQEGLVKDILFSEIIVQ